MRNSVSVPAVKQVPQLEIAERISTNRRFTVPSKFCYEARDHKELPHVVKFSGGRSSGLMLFTLLESGLLDSDRGDVIVFNNTSAEHPATYEFARHCKQVVEERYQIPFLWIEFQTYEDASDGEWVRMPSYRLVQPEPWSNANPDGYHWKGQVFEELLSWKTYVPNQFRRICTATLKLQTTRAFLEDWLANKPSIQRLGHHGNGPRSDPDEVYERHLRNKGGVPKDIFLKKKEFIDQRPIFRPAQKFADFSAPAKPFSNHRLAGLTHGESAYFGDDGIEYLAFVGLRADEERRVVKVRERNTAGPEMVGYEGEHVYMPLFNMGIDQEQVQAFWEAQDWDLDLNPADSLSNCTYCFLKGFKNLKRVHTALSAETNHEYKDTPCDLEWWIGIEKKYGRNLVAEGRKIKAQIPDNFIGFFSTQAGFSYEKIDVIEEGSESEAGYIENVLPCDCTD